MTSESRPFLSRLGSDWLNGTDARRACCLLFLCSALFVLVNWRSIPSDNIAMPLLPVSLLRHGTLDLDAFRPYYEDLPDDQNYSFTESNGHLYPMKAYFSALLATPLYVPPVLANIPTLQENTKEKADKTGERYSVEFWTNWGRLSTATLAGLSVALMYLALRRWADVTEATAFSLLFGFGTCVWTIVGQTLSHQLGGVVCSAALVLCLHDFPLSVGRAAWAGFLAGATVVMRPPTVVMLLPLGLYLMFWPGLLDGWKARLSSFAGLLVMPILYGVANSCMFGHWYKTGYPREEVTGQWTTPILEGAAGLLISPNCGLLVQSPFTLLAFVGGWAVWRSATIRDAGLLRAYSLCFIPYWLMFACWHDWKGGMTFSSRMLCEGYPLWMPLVVLGWKQIEHLSWARRLAIAAGIFAVVYELANVAVFDRVTPTEILSESVFGGRERRLYPWLPNEHFFALYVRHFGLWSAVRDVSLTSGLFVVCCAAVILAWRPFWKSEVRLRT